jgi:hypothetical protein
MTDPEIIRHLEALTACLRAATHQQFYDLPPRNTVRDAMTDHAQAIMQTIDIIHTQRPSQPRR